MENTTGNKRFSRWILATALLGAIFLSACAGKQSAHKADILARTDNWDEAVLHYAKAVAEDPNNIQFKMKLMRARIKAAQVHVERGKRYQEAALYREAADEYQQALVLDPTHQLAADELAKVSKYVEAEDSKRLGITIDEMKEEASKMVSTPRLHPQSNVPIKIKFADQEIKDVFTALCKVAGLNILFDSSLTERKISVDLQDTTFLQAMEILGIQTGTFYKVIDPYTIIIAPDSRQKRQEYEDQVIKTFYLSNASVKDVFALLRGLIDARNIAQNDQLNSITIKDSPDKVAVAERIVRANDKAKGEVVVEVELLEVNRKRQLDFGPALGGGGVAGYSIGAGLDIITKGVDSTKATPRLHEMNLLDKKHNWLIGPIPQVTYGLYKSITDARVLAQPQLRVTEGEKAQVHIGDQVPIPTTTFNTITSGTTGVQPITNFTYQSVGIQIHVEPRVHHNYEVTLKVQVEVSSITSINTAAQPTIGTRKIDTVIRLKDGQVNLLAGLIKEDESDSLSGIPGLVDVPVLKRIFGRTGKSKSQTDIVLSLTPHIIRMPNITVDDLKSVWIGSGERVKLMEDQPPTTNILMGKGEWTASSSAAPRSGVQSTAPASFQAPAPSTAAPPPPPTAPPASAPALLAVSPGNVALEAGEEMDLQLSIENGASVAGIALTLSYNAKVLHITQAAEGGYLRVGGQPVTFTQNVDNGSGSAEIRCSGQGGANGGGVLVNLKIQGVGEGVSPLVITRAEIRTAAGGMQPVMLSPARIQVSHAP